MFKKLLGGGKGEQAPQPKPAVVSATISTIQQLADHEEMLEKRKSMLEKRMDAELEKARAFNKAGKKQQALVCLKKKKLLETDFSKIDNMIMRVIEQRNMLEGQQTTVQVVSTMHSAATTAKANMKHMNMSNVDQVLEDINDTNDQMRQINDAMSNPIGAAADIDEDDLLGELEELEATELDKELLQSAPVPTSRVQGTAQAMPSAPRQKIPAKTAEELELEALQAEMAV